MFRSGMKSKSSSPIIQAIPLIPTAASSSSALPPWTELPDDLTTNILQRLDAEERLMSAQLVCSTWWRVCKNPAMWRVIDLDTRRKFDDKFDSICRCAVDRSQGQLVELKLCDLYVLEMLNYVVERSCQLRCLTILELAGDEDEINEAIKKLPQLEELHFFSHSLFDNNDFETIGIACPRLKSLTYHNCFRRTDMFSEHVEEIGKSMPNLCHLRICEYSIGYKGLEALAHGCSHLKSLDLRLCPGLDCDFDCGKSFSEERKDLWLSDSMISLEDWIKEWNDYYYEEQQDDYPSSDYDVSDYYTDGCDIFDIF